MTEQQTQLLDEAFERWWHQEGSKMPPLPGEEQVEHIKRISRIAWHNGSYVKFHNIPITKQRQQPMTEHPLTDEICFAVYENSKHHPDEWMKDMRAAADWQLEEVMTKVELKLKEWRIQGLRAMADACEDFFEEIMQELRPQQQQEDNND